MRKAENRMIRISSVVWALRRVGGGSIEFSNDKPIDEVRPPNHKQKTGRKLKRKSRAVIASLSTHILLYRNMYYPGKANSKSNWCRGAQWLLRNCVPPTEHVSVEQTKQRRVESHESTLVGGDNASDIREYPQKTSCSPFWLINCISQYPFVYYRIQNRNEKTILRMSTDVFTYLILVYSLTAACADRSQTHIGKS